MKVGLTTMIKEARQRKQIVCLHLFFLKNPSHTSKGVSLNDADYLLKGEWLLKTLLVLLVGEDRSKSTDEYIQRRNLSRLRNWGQLRKHQRNGARVFVLQLHNLFGHP